MSDHIVSYWTSSGETKRNHTEFHIIQSLELMINHTQIPTDILAYFTISMLHLCCIQVHTPLVNMYKLFQNYIIFQSKTKLVWGQTRKKIEQFLVYDILLASGAILDYSVWILDWGVWKNFGHSYLPPQYSYLGQTNSHILSVRIICLIYCYIDLLVSFKWSHSSWI